MDDEKMKLKCVSLKELAELLGYSEETILDWVAKGIFPPPWSATRGAPLRWLIEVVHEWIKKRGRSRMKQKPRGFVAKRKARPHIVPVGEASNDEPVAEKPKGRRKFYVG